MPDSRQRLLDFMTTPQPIRLSIGSMSCAGCVAAVEKALNAVVGVESATVNFAEHTAEVEGGFSTDALIKAVVDAGYEAALLQSEEDTEEKPIAFGLKALMMNVVVEDEEGVMDKLEESIGSVPGVQNAKVVTLTKL